MRVGVTATQVGLTPLQREGFRKLLWTLGCTEFHHGDCVGGDAVAHQIAKLDVKAHVVIHPPVVESKRAFCRGDEVLPAKDYLKRNRDIVDSTDVLVGMPKGLHEELRSGTWSTIRYARKKGHPVYVIFPDGTQLTYNL